MNEQHEKDIATAKLALALNNNKAQGEPPSTEELAALYNNRLSSQRRQEVLDSIANTPSIYRQWIALVESHQAPSQQTHAQPPAKSLLTTVCHYLSKFSEGLKPRVLLSGTALASLLFMVVTLQAPYYTVEQLYQEHNQQWSPNLFKMQNGLNTRSVQLFGRYTTPLEQALHQGLALGLDSLGEHLFIDGISNKPPLLPAKSTIPDEEYEHLVIIARVMAIAHFKCQQSSSDKFYQQANNIVQHSLKKLQNSRYPAVQALVEQLSFSQSLKKNICKWQKQIIELAKR